MDDFLKIWMFKKRKHDLVRTHEMETNNFVKQQSINDLDEFYTKLVLMYTQKRDI